MKVELDPKYGRRLERLAASTGRSVAEVLEEIVEKGLEEMAENGDKRDGEAQRQALERFLEELDQLPVGNPDDGFSGAEHDDVLYRRDW